MSRAKKTFALSMAALCLLLLQSSVQTLVSGGICAQSIYSASNQCLVAGGQRGASENYWSANTLGQPSPLGIGNSDLYELIAGVYGESTVVTSSEDLSLMPRTHLYQNYPNPFNPTTTIEYSVASRGRVMIEIFSINGQRIKLLVNETKEPGRYTTTWSGKNESDQPVATGIYFCRLRVDTSSSVRKMLIIR